MVAFKLTFVLNLTIIKQYIIHPYIHTYIHNTKKYIHTLQTNEKMEHKNTLK